MLKIVNDWRRLKTEENISLEKAANKVGMARKSLDDYMRILNHAKKLKFNFVKHLNDHFAVLR